MVHALALALLAGTAAHQQVLPSAVALCAALQALLVVLETSRHGGWTLLVPLVVLLVR